MHHGKVKFAIVGAGHIGKRHAEMVRRNPDAELVAIADILPAEQLGVLEFGVPYFQSAEALFASGLDFDVVNICSPNGLHATHSIMALEHRKHIVCEKPWDYRRPSASRLFSRPCKCRDRFFASCKTAIRRHRCGLKN